MPANVYECMFLLDTNKVAGDVPAAAQQLHAILERNQAEVLASRPWDERRLAYPVKGQKKGLYYLTYFRSEGKNLVNIERDFALNETILRMLVIHIDPKLVDVMLALARDEHAFALHSVTESEGDETGDMGDGDMGGRERRGRRPLEVAD
jgi:small subunit ribosomal protein S6